MTSADTFVPQPWLDRAAEILAAADAGMGQGWLDRAHEIRGGGL